MDKGEDLEALRLEYMMMHSPGWDVFKATLLEKFHEASAKLCFSGYKDDKDRLHSEGHCQFYKMIMDHEAAVKNTWRELQEEQIQPETDLEGGDLGVNYEAAQ